MEDYNFIEEIEKSKKFISTKISNGFIKVNNIGKNVASIFIDKETCVFKENSDDEYKAIYLYQEDENNLYDFKNEIEKSKKFLSANSFIILRYVNLYNDNIEYIEEELIKTLTLKKFIDIESYIILPNNNRKNKELIIIARWHIDLLDDVPEYESYSENFYRKKSCGGCGCGGKGKCTSCNKK